jgi:hypothetical protein
MDQFDEAVLRGASAHLCYCCRKGEHEHGLTRFIRNFDSPVVEGSGWQVIPEVAKIARQAQSLAACIMKVG